MGKRKITTIVLALILIAAMLFSIGCNTKASTTTAATTSTSASTKDFQLGTMFALSGEFSWVGEVMLNGTQMAVSEINASGELPMKLVVNVGDHKGGDVDAATAAARKQLDVNKISVMLTSWPNVSMALAPLCGASNVSSLNGGGNGLDLVNVPWLLTSRDLLDQMLSPLLQYFKDELNVKNLAIIGSTEASGIQGGDLATFYANKLGMKIVDWEKHEPGQKDYKAAITKIKAANPDALLITSFGDDISYTLRDAKQLGLNIPMGTFMDVYQTGIDAVGPEVHEGFYDAKDFFDVNSTLPWAKTYVQNYKKTYPGVDVEIYGANYYELVYVVKDAIKYVISHNGNPNDGKQIYDAIKAIGTFNSLYGDGKMTILDDGTCIKPVAIRQFHNGAFEVVKMMTPARTVGMNYK
jgi:branched-chain amino acid transport system substrate-binding protein